MSTEIEIELPLFIQLKESNILPNDLGAFSTINIKPNRLIGNFIGKIRNTIQPNEDLSYIWTILNTKQVPVFYIDATDPRDSNWLRFIRSTNDLNKQNIICLQQDKKINYYTLKEIKPGDELVCYSSYETNKKAKQTTYEIIPNTPSELSIENEESKDSYNTQNTSDDDVTKPKRTKSKNGKRTLNGSSSTSASGSNTVLSQQSTRVWTCQMCKKQFDQRVLLNRHECIDLKLRLLIKKKEMRKKKLKDLHSKRRIDLSFIETSNLTHLYNNIADNLCFCIDGTKQDLKSYSKEVKDYLNSMVMNKENNQIVYRK